MNNDEIRGSWNEQKGKLKQIYADLTDDYLLFEECKIEVMLGKIQLKLGKSKEELNHIISKL